MSIEYISHTVISGSTSSTLSLCKAPTVDTRVETKGTVLQYLLNTLRRIVTEHPFCALASPLRELIPIPTQASEFEADEIGTLLRAALIDPKQAAFEAVAFYNGNGHTTIAELLPSARRGDSTYQLRFIKVKTTLEPSTVDKRFINENTITGYFFLELPQHPVDSNEVGVRRLTFEATPASARTEVPPTMRSAVQQTRLAAYNRPKSHRDNDGFTYMGDLNFLQDAGSFTRLFGASPTIYQQVNKEFIALAPHDSFTLETRHLVWSIFESLLWSDYVGTEISKGISTNEIFQSLQAIKSRIYCPKEKRNIFFTPDDIYLQYIEWIPLLPRGSTAEWGFVLHLLYIQSLSPDIREALNDENGPFHYTMPKISSFNTVTSQTTALRVVRSLASSAYKEGQKLDARLNRFHTNKQQSRPQANVHTTYPSSSPATTLVSPAELVMAREMAKTAEPVYPTDPVTGYTSRWPVGFRNCFLCGEPPHKDRNDCPIRHTDGSSDKFHREYFAHFPDKRKKPPSASERYQPGSTNDRPPKTAKLLVTVGAITLITNCSSSTRDMPIALDNMLPTVFFDLSGPTDPSSKPLVSLGCLADTCAALSSGNRHFHDHVRFTYPECVYAFEAFDDANPFNVIALAGAITTPSDYRSDTHGILNAVITYRTAYTLPNGEPMLLKFALGDDVAVNSIMGLPTMRGLLMLVDIPNENIFSRSLHRSFPLEFITPRCGVPKPAPSIASLGRQVAPQPSLVTAASNVVHRADIDNRPAWQTRAAVAPALPPLPSAPPLVEPVIVGSPPAPSPTATASPTDDLPSSTAAPATSAYPTPPDHSATTSPAPDHQNSSAPFASASFPYQTAALPAISHSASMHLLSNAPLNNMDFR